VGFCAIILRRAFRYANAIYFKPSLDIRESCLPPETGVSLGGFLLELVVMPVCYWCGKEILEGEEHAKGAMFPIHHYCLLEEQHAWELLNVSGVRI
jgi:hypothetical protein